jgi:hypothetical protein
MVLAEIADKPLVEEMVLLLHPPPDKVFVIPVMEFADSVPPMPTAPKPSHPPPTTTVTLMEPAVTALLLDVPLMEVKTELPPTDAQPLLPELPSVLTRTVKPFATLPPTFVKTLALPMISVPPELKFGL